MALCLSGRSRLAPAMCWLLMIVAPEEKTHKFHKFGTCTRKSADLLPSVCLRACVPSVAHAKRQSNTRAGLEKLQ